MSRCMSGKFSKAYVRQDQKWAISMANTFTFLVFNHALQFFGVLKWTHPRKTLADQETDIIHRIMDIPKETKGTKIKVYNER